MPIESNSSNGQFLVLQEGSPYKHQGAYRRSFVISSEEDIVDFDKFISPDIKSSYIQQNLPVRRQSLQVYQNRRQSVSEDSYGDCEYRNESPRSPKRHSSLNFPLMLKKSEVLSTSQLSHEAPLPTLSACTLNNIKSPKPNCSLSIQINYYPNTSDASSENLNSATTLSSTDFSMNTLIEEDEDDLLDPQPKQPVQRFMGRLRPSKSDQSSMSKSFHQKEEVTLSHSWNDAPQPLTKLKSVLSRIQSGSNNKRNCEGIIKKNNRADVKTKNTDIACLSYVAEELMKTIQVKNICSKYGINYHHVFYGSDIVTCLVEILQTKDRVPALVVGKSLATQGLFHHVNYEYKLCDDDTFYQFHMENENWPYDDLPLLPKKANRRLDNSFDKTVSVNGVLTLFTDCYSPTCTLQRPCYSISCPNKTQKEPQQRGKNYRKERKLWRYSVPLNVVTRTPDIEKRRQECIYELIYTEEDFAKDLQYMQNLWIKPILCGDIITDNKKHEFIHEVFWNLSEIENVSESLLSDLRSRQNQHSVIPMIGDIILSHAQNFTPFISYGAHQIFGKFKYELERKNNSKFQHFAEKLERQPESRRLELNGYLTKPTARLGRYNLLLNEIHQLTPKDHEDYKLISKAMDTITRILVQLNVQVGLSDNRFHLQQLSSRLLLPKGYDLQLLDPKRQLILRGKMKRKSSLGSSENGLEIQVFLFDHYLVLSKIKHHDQVEYYKVIQKPIPLATLSVSTTPPGKNTGQFVGYPITFYSFHPGGSIPLTTLVVANDSTRKLWMDKILEQTIPLSKNRAYLTKDINSAIKTI